MINNFEIIYFVIIHYLAQEAVQNMYISFYNHLNKINNGMAIIQWMNTTTINECRALIKKEKLNSKVDIENYKNSLIDTNLNPEDSYKYKDKINILNEALDELEPQLKEIVIYRYVDNLKIKEISKLTKLSTATINRYIKTAIMKLRKHMENLNNKIYGLIASPAVFKLFNEIMKNQTSNKQIIDSYTKFSNTVKFGSKAAASAVGIKTIASISKKTSSLGTKIAAGCGTAATAVAVGAVIITPNYSISTLNGDYVLSQVISLSSNNIDQIQNVYCYKDEILIGELNKNNNYSIDISQNGHYVIIVKDIVGKTQKEKIEINNIDYECPTVDIIRKNDVYEATISDSQSGIDYDKIKIINQNGQTVDYSINGNVITFTSSNQKTELTIYDNLGNSRKVELILR